MSYRTKFRPRASRSRRLQAFCTIGMLAWGCGDEVLDVGRGEPYENPRYATPDILNAEGNAGTGDPTLVATHQFGARALVLDETRVYWSASVAVPGQMTQDASPKSCSKTDCAGTLVMYKGSPGGALSFAVNRTHLFWTERAEGRTEAYSIFSCPIAGCSGSPTLVLAPVFLTGPNGLTETPLAWSIVADEEYVFWLSRDAMILKCAISGCGNTPTLVAQLETTSNRSLQVDEKHLYWAVGGLGTPGAISTMPKDGSAPPRNIAENEPLPDALVVDATHVYWVDAAVGLIKTCPLTGCVGEPAVLVSETRPPMLMDIGGERAYWFAPTGATIGGGQPSPGELVERSLNDAGVERSVIAVEPGGPSALAIDATHIYWTAYASQAPSPLDRLPSDPDGAVKRLRRRP